MPELGELTLESFTGLVGDRFSVTPAPPAPAPALALRLTAAEPLADPPGPGLRAPFSLIFTGPAEPILAQMIHRLEHERLGALDIFLVALAPDAAGACYQAVFS
ncbi:MAG: hypothetical protein ABSH51_06040 [Solirubrobacteraceae bacterium]|jgi:hypothetical protein